MVGRQASFMDPRTWGSGRLPSHEYVVQEGRSGQLQLHRMIQQTAMRPRQRADAPDDSRSGLRVIEPDVWTGRQTELRKQRLLQAAANLGASQTPPLRRPGCKQRRRRRRQTGAAVRQRSSAPAASAAAGPPEPGDLQDRTAWQVRQASAPVPLGQGWHLVSDRRLDRRQRILASRILHGKLPVGSFLRRTGTTTRGQHVWPYACCNAEPAMLTHVFVDFPLELRWWHGCTPPGAL